MNKEKIIINGVEYERCVKGLAFRPVGTDINSLAYKYWVGIIYRTLDDNSKGNIAQWYKDVTICDEWIYFDNFKRWFDENYYKIEGCRMEIDKDLVCDSLGYKIKVYSPSTCYFLPKSINNLLTYRQNERALTHDGIVLPCNIHERFTAKGYKYYGQVRMGRNENGKEVRPNTPTYDTIEEAWEATYILKRSAICERAEQYKEFLSKDIYQLLLAYEPKKY